MFGCLGMSFKGRAIRRSYSDTATGFHIGTGGRTRGASARSAYGCTGVRVKKPVRKIRRTLYRLRKSSFSHDVVGSLLVRFLVGGALLAVCLAMPVNGLGLAMLLVAVTAAVLTGYMVVSARHRKRGPKYRAVIRKAKSTGGAI